MANNAQLLTIFIDAAEVRHLLKTNKIAAKLAPLKPAKAAEPKAQAKADKPPATLSDAEKAEQTAARMLIYARTLADDGKKDKAKTRYEEILKQYPMTEAAKEAKVLLDKLTRK
jgi:hypothetical protein